MSSGGAAPSPEQQEAYLAQVQQQLQTKFMQDLLQNVTEGCYKKCTGTSGNELSSGEKSCLSNCMKRYMDTMNVVQGTLQDRQNR